MMNSIRKGLVAVCGLIAFESGPMPIMSSTLASERRARTRYEVMMENVQNVTAMVSSPNIAGFTPEPVHGRSGAALGVDAP